MMEPRNSETKQMGGTPIKRNGINAHQVDRISSLDLDAKI